MMGQSKSEDDTELRRVIDKTKDCADIQRDFDRIERWFKRLFLTDGQVSPRQSAPVSNLAVGQLQQGKFKKSFV